MAIVQAHFDAEDSGRIEPALDLYTDDVVWEGPARKVRLHGKADVAANYNSMFRSMSDVEIRTHQRFASTEGVVDEATMKFPLTGDRLANAPLAPGNEVSMRVVHIFGIRDGKIARESVYETWPAASGAGPGEFLLEDSDPNPERLLRVGLGFWEAKALLSAVELGVFTELTRAPQTGRALAQRRSRERQSYER
jgi:steroid delta-isomerase-like uncharacterized protein